MIGGLGQCCKAVWGRRGCRICSGRSSRCVCGKSMRGIGQCGERGVGGAWASHMVHGGLAGVGEKNGGGGGG